MENVNTAVETTVDNIEQAIDEITSQVTGKYVHKPVEKKEYTPRAFTPAIGSLGAALISAEKRELGINQISIAISEKRALDVVGLINNDPESNAKLIRSNKIGKTISMVKKAIQEKIDSGVEIAERKKLWEDFNRMKDNINKFHPYAEQPVVEEGIRLMMRARDWKGVRNLLDEFPLIFWQEINDDGTRSYILKHVREFVYGHKKGDTYSPDYLEFKDKMNKMKSAV